MSDEIQKCGHCTKAIPFGATVVCETCADHADCDADDVPRAGMFESPQSVVRAWADRQRLLHGMSPELVAEFERCATDIEEGFHG